MAKILVIDPSPIDRKRMRSVLEAAGHTVAEAVTPEEARHGMLARPGAVSLLLTELQFPEETGLDLLRWLRDEDRLHNLSVLVVTHQPPRETLIEMISTGASTIITKPFGPDMLLRRVTETLAERMAISQGEGLNLSWQIPDYINRELKRVERTRSSLSVIVCRITEPTDDEAVPRLLAGLVHVVREYDVLARLSDQEVILLLPDTDGSGSAAVLSRVGDLVREWAAGTHHRPAISLQVATGLATYPLEAPDGESLISLALNRARYGMPEANMPR
jgi:PleD family two-component response regulator